MTRSRHHSGIRCMLPRILLGSGSATSSLVDMNMARCRICRETKSRVLFFGSEGIVIVVQFVFVAGKQYHLKCCGNAHST